jgi:predicted permease
MSSIAPVMDQIIMLFLIGLCGLFLRRAGIFTDAVIKGVNKLVLVLCWPAMMLMVTQKDCSPELLAGFAQVLIAGVIILSVATIIMYLVYSKGNRKKYRPVAATLCAMPNAGFMGLPIITAVYGDTGALLLAAYIVAFNLVMWTLSVSTFTGFNVKSLKGMLNPGFIFAIIGVALFLLKIRLPSPLLTTVNQLGALNTPLSMLLLGARIDGMKPRELANIHLWIPAAIKLLALPALTLVVCRMAGMSGIPLGVTVLATAMPAASGGQMLAEKNDCEVGYASVGVFLSTLLCIVTIPLVLMMIGA